MIDKVIEAVSIKLDAVFGDGYTIYTESVRQGLEEPCFFILALEPSIDEKLSSRTVSLFPLNVHYFPANKKQKNKEMHEVGERLFCELNLITADKATLRGTKMRYQIVDDVMHFFVTYQYHDVLYVPEEPMEELTVQNGLKEG